MFIAKNKTELRQTIKLIDDAYLNLTSLYYRDADSNLINFGSTNLIDVSDSTEFISELKRYVNFMSKHLWDDCILELSARKIRNRVKSLGSLNEKIYQYNSSRRLKGKVRINKSINDLVGARFLVKNLNDNLEDYLEYIKQLKNTDIVDIYRPYIKNKDTSKYCAIHIYLKDTNKHFCWEIQLWDPNSLEDNKLEHAKHEEDRLKY